MFVKGVINALIFCANICFVRYFNSCEDNIESLCQKLCNRDPRIAMTSCKPSMLAKSHYGI